MNGRPAYQGWYGGVVSTVHDDSTCSVAYGFTTTASSFEEHVTPALVRQPARSRDTLVVHDLGLHESASTHRDSLRASLRLLATRVRGAASAAARVRRRFCTWRTFCMWHRFRTVEHGYNANTLYHKTDRVQKHKKN